MNEFNITKSKKIIVILIVIMILLLMLSFSFLNFGRLNDYIPTGNVDVFNINVDCDCICDDIPAFDPEEEVIGEVRVDDTNGSFVYQQNLNIFRNPAYQMKEIVAPGDSNLYHFVVNNNTNHDVNYEINMYETTEYDVNMKYRLKLNGDYVVGDNNNWVSAEDLNLEDIYLLENDSSTYSLEWKWFDSENDSYIGENMDGLYRLSIKLNFEVVQEV